MTHFLAMLQKKVGDIEDGRKHHSNHGQYEDVRLPHRDKQGGEEEETR